MTSSFDPIRAFVARLHTGQRGEGVISAAIAVLIMAFIGVAMWLAFSNTFSSVADTTDDLVEQIGN